MAETLDAGLRLAIYARVSTEEQREGQTIDSQIAELERFARDKGWPIIQTYKDDGWSGGVMERPELDRLRDDAQKGLFDAVLINDVDRLARDVAHLGVIKRDLERKGIRVIFRKLPSEASPTHNLMVNILGSFAEFERELIADRTRRGRRHKVEVRKLYLGSNTSYGYRYYPMNHLSGTGGVLEVEPTEAAVVRQMFEWVDQEGLSSRQTLRRLNTLKVPPKKGAASWGKSSVLRILRNEMYCGVWYYNKFQGCEPRSPQGSVRYRRRTKCSLKMRPQNEWIPLQLPEPLRVVPRDRWERVQRQISQNITFSPRNGKHVYLLQGLIRCGGCGARYTGDPCHGKFYYRCVARCKKMPSVRESALDEAVKRAATSVMLRPEIILEPLRELSKAQAKETAGRQRVEAEVEREERRLDTEEQRILDAYRGGIITPGQLAQQLEKVKVTRKALDVKKIEAHQMQEPPPAETTKAVADYCAEAANNIARFTHLEWRDFLRVIVATVVFHGSHITIQGRIPVRIGDRNRESDFKIDGLELA